jgi:hypothetical protein
MTTLAELRRAEVQKRKDEREAAKRQKSYERALKEHARLTLQEEARLEVEQHEGSIEISGEFED